MSIEKVAFSSLVAQAWEQLRGTVLELEEVKRRIEELAWAEQTSRLGRATHARAGNSLRGWGYRIRKVVLTHWGMIQGLRLPRIRDLVRIQEVPFLRSEGGEYRLVEMLLASTLGGMSYRKVLSWARHHLGLVISTTRVGRVVEAAAERIESRRRGRFTPRQFDALVVDAVWVHNRRSPR
jgi:hypothetical protein